MNNTGEMRIGISLITPKDNPSYALEVADGLATYAGGLTRLRIDRNDEGFLIQVGVRVPRTFTTYALVGLVQDLANRGPIFIDEICISDIPAPKGEES